MLFIATYLNSSYYTVTSMEDKLILISRFKNLTRKDAIFNLTS